MRYCCDRPVYVVLWRIMQGIWNFRLEKPLSIQSLVGCSVGEQRRRVFKEMQNWRPSLWSFRKKQKLSGQFILEGSENCWIRPQTQRVYKHKESSFFRINQHVGSTNWTKWWLWKMKISSFKAKLGEFQEKLVHLKHDWVNMQLLY